MEIHFTEQMKGARHSAGPGIPAETPAADMGFRFIVTVVVPSIAILLKDPGSLCRLTGRVFMEDADKQEWSAPIMGSHFRLFAGETKKGPVQMQYHIEYEDPRTGETVLLDGFKDLRRRTPLRIWRDTTTLFSTWKNAHDGADDFQGILRIHLLDFLKQLTTFRAYGGSFNERAKALLSFFALFIRVLWNLYGLRI